MSERADLVVIFAGGGTGGHLYPGLAVAEALRDEARLVGTSVRSIFVCSDRPLDAEILGKAGAAFVASPAKPMVVRPRGLVRFLRTWGRAVREARAVIRRERGEAGAPVVVVAMGGFVAAPAAQAARVEGAPLVLVNLDAVPGKANRFIAWRARGMARGAGIETPVMTTIPVRAGHGGAGEWPTIGPIVRAGAMAPAGQGECRRRLGLDEAAPVLMVTGGSQGAKSINELMMALAAREAAVFREWQVVHQCGKGEPGVEAIRSAYVAAGMKPERVIVQEFSDRMGEWWGAAELAVCRAGAGSVAEAWANRVASVFLPYPFHKDEHQRWNAEPLAAAGAGALVKDRVSADANLGEAGREIATLMRDAAHRAAMRAALERMGPARGAAEVARRVLALGARAREKK